MAMQPINQTTESGTMKSEQSNSNNGPISFQWTKTKSAAVKKKKKIVVVEKPVNSQFSLHADFNILL